MLSVCVKVMVAYVRYCDAASLHLHRSIDASGWMQRRDDRANVRLCAFITSILRCHFIWIDVKAGWNRGTLKCRRAMVDGERSWDDPAMERPAGGGASAAADDDRNCKTASRVMRTTTSARAGATITNSSFMTSASTQTNNIYARIGEERNPCMARPRTGRNPRISAGSNSS